MNSPGNMNSVNKGVIVTTAAVTTIGTRHLIETLDPRPVQVRMRTEVAATTRDVRDLHQQLCHTRIAVTLPARVCQYQTDWTWKTKLPGSYGKQPQYEAALTRGLIHEIRHLVP